jgi:predicted RND superfamily exporter protein
MHRLPRALNRFVARHPWLTIAVFSAVSAFLAAGLPRLHIEPDIREVMPRDHPDMLFDDWTKEFFGIEDPGVLLIINDGPDGIFTPSTLALIKTLSEQVAAVEQVDGDDVVSLSEIDDITADGDTLRVDPFYRQAPSTRAEALAVRDAVFANPMMVGSIVSRDGRATMIVAERAPGGDKVQLYAALVRIAAAAPIHTERVLIAGRSVIEGEMGLISRRDVERMFPLVIVAVAALLALSLRTVRGVLLPILVVVVSTIWTLGTMAWTGMPFHAVSSMIPSLLVAIGVADGIHVIHHFTLETARRPGAPPAEVVADTMDELFAPVVMTSLTTAAGFISLAMSPLRSMQILGIAIAIGVLAAMVFSLTLLPAVLAVLPLPVGAARRAADAQAREDHPVTRLMRGFATLAVDRPRAVLTATMLIALAAAAGIPNVAIDASLLKNFPPDNPVRLADAEIRKHFGGTTPVEVILDGGQAGAWKDPERLRALVALQDELEGRGVVGETRSIADFVRRMNQVMNPDDPDAYRIPDDRELIAQYLLLYSISGEPDDFDDVVDYDYRYANLRAQLVSDRSPWAAAVLGSVEDWAHEHLEPLGVATRIAGAGQTSVMFVNLIVTSQVRSLAIGLVLVGVLAAILGRSPVAGIFCLVPVLVGTLCNFAVLGWGGLPLDVVTALASSMGIGIGVDYAIHFVVRYRRAVDRGSSPARAIDLTMRSAGVAILYNAVVVMIGFALLSTSGFRVNRTLGLLVAMNMAVCFLATLTTLAAALYTLRPAFSRGSHKDRR